LVSIDTSPNFTFEANNAFMSLVVYSKPHALVSMVTTAMLTYPKPLLSKDEW
jgi:hypothetical protein